MSSASEFWSLVQAELDARHDPLEHFEILAWLESHPADLDAFASLRAVGLRLDQELAPALAVPAPSAAPAAHSPKQNRWHRLRPLALVAAALALYVMLPKNSAELEPTPPPLTAFTSSNPGPAAAPSPSPSASLISIEHSRVDHYAQTNFAPADPQSGAIILSMSTRTRRTTL